MIERCAIMTPNIEDMNFHNMKVNPMVVARSWLKDTRPQWNVMMMVGRLVYPQEGANSRWKASYATQTLAGDLDPQDIRN